MKKKMSMKLFSLLLVVATLLALVGCGEKAELDPGAVTETLLNSVAFDDTLEEVGSASSMYFSGLPEGTQVKLYMGKGAHADEVAVLTAASEADAKTAAEAAKAHLTELRNSFANYIPAELDKIDHAVVEQSGKYVFICVTNDYENAKSVLTKAFG